MENKSDVPDRTMQLFNKCAQHFKTQEDLALYAMTVASLGVALLRGIEGNEFTRGFLIGAIEEKNPLVIKPQALN